MRVSFNPTPTWYSPERRSLRRDHRQYRNLETRIKRRLTCSKRVDRESSVDVRHGMTSSARNRSESVQELASYRH